MKQKERLGIVDWGIGGLGVYRCVKSALGDIPVLYVSDSGATPYGRMSRGELVARLNGVLRFFRSNDVMHVVLGCNAASTVLPLLDIDGMKVEGVIESAVGAVTAARPERLAVIGGRRTILSGVYRRAFALRGIGVRQRIAQPLSGMIEEGDTGSERLHRECERILSPIGDSSHILLACTHYPAIVPVMREHVSSRTEFVDPAGELVEIVRRWNLPIGGGDQFLTSGDPDTMKFASRGAFGIDIETASGITI